MEVELRIALLVAGLAVLAALYFWGRARGRAAARQRKKFENFDFEEEDLPNPLDSDPDPGPDPNPGSGAVSGVAAVDTYDSADSTDKPDTGESGSGYQPSLLGSESEEEAGIGKLIVVHVMAKRPRMFNGAEIVNLAREFELEYDDMHVFHRKVKRLGDKKAMYSVVNAVKPGTFDLDSMDTFETPGISFVMSLPGPEKGLKAFNIMLEAAKKSAKRLRGDLMDESRSRLSAETISRMQEEVQLYSLKHPNQNQDT